MTNKYQIQCRYEYFSGDGKSWTKWFDMYGDTYKTLPEAEEGLKRLKEKIKSIDKITKLKHEYKIKDYED